MKLFMLFVGLAFIGFGCVVIRESRGPAHVVAGFIFVLTGFLFMVPALWN
jgi:hypothetical protein